MKDRGGLNAFYFFLLAVAIDLPESRRIIVLLFLTLCLGHAVVYVYGIWKAGKQSKANAARLRDTPKPDEISIH